MLEAMFIGKVATIAVIALAGLTAWTVTKCSSCSPLVEEDEHILCIMGYEFFMSKFRGFHDNLSFV